MPSSDTLTPVPRPTSAPKTLSNPTPLVELTGLDAGPCRILAKLECMNPTGSIKDRVAGAMVDAAEKAGDLRAGMTLVEGSSGNTTIALGAVALRRGYSVLALLPHSMTEEKKRLHRALGVQCEYFEADTNRPFTNTRRDRALQMAAAEPDRFCCLDQFSNAANLLAHERHTGAEVWSQAVSQGIEVDRYFSGAGTGGSLVGIARALKRSDRWPDMGVTMVDPAGSTLTARFQGVPPSREHQAAPDGIGERYLPANLDLALVDQAVTVPRDQAVGVCSELVQATGILGGPCSGFILKAALDWCRQQTEPKTILVLICDRGENYLSDPQYAEAIASGFVERRRLLGRA